MIGIGESVQSFFAVFGLDVLMRDDGDIVGNDESVDYARIGRSRRPFDVVVPATRGIVGG